MIIGFSSGSAAAGAAKAAAYMLLFKWKRSTVEIETPRGLMHTAILKDVVVTNDSVSCAVKKDGGIEPDIYEAYVYARVRLLEKNTTKNEVSVIAGTGIGQMVLDTDGLKVGDYAISSSARTMIEQAVIEVCHLADVKCHIEVTVSIPGGEEIASLKYHPRMGIADGLRIIGDKKSIEPMNSQTVIKSIYVELHQRHELGFRHVAITNGDYGRAYFDKKFRYEIVDKCVKCSNYIGDTIDMAVKLGFKTIILSGNLEKLVKLAAGIMNTHSMESDARLDILSSIAVLEGADAATAKTILLCTGADEAVEIIRSAGIYDVCMRRLVDRIVAYIKRRIKVNIDVECILFKDDNTFVAQSYGADKWLTLLSQEASR